MIVYKKNIIFFTFCLLSLLCEADTIGRIIQQNKQTKTRFAILAADANTGTVLYRQNSDAPMIPASNMKVVTSAAAVHYLGGDYVFQTKIGLLKDDLIVIGGGDPLLGDPKLAADDSQAAEKIFETIVLSLKKANVTSVDDIIVDVSFFDNNRVHPSWPVDQLNQWYACEVSGLNFNNNCVRLIASRQSNRAVLAMEPPNRYLTLINQLKLISKGNSAVGAYRNSVPNKLYIKGKLNKQAGFDVAIENPQGLFASLVRDRLTAAGIAVKGNIVQRYAKQDKGIQLLAVFETPISDVLKRCNKDSLGLAAESLLKTISAENTQGRINGEWPHGLALISRYLQSLGVKGDQYILDDGCGLSRKDHLSPAAIVAVLNDMYTCENREMYYDSLAVGGVDGTISKYFRRSPYKGNIRGKTGYISGVRSFSGICKTPRGDVLFSILTVDGNGYTRGCINEITQAIYDGKY